MRRRLPKEQIACYPTHHHPQQRLSDEGVLRRRMRYGEEEVSLLEVDSLVLAELSRKSSSSLRAAAAVGCLLLAVCEKGSVKCSPLK